MHDDTVKSPQEFRDFDIFDQNSYNNKFCQPSETIEWTEFQFLKPDDTESKLSKPEPVTKTSKNYVTSEKYHALNIHTSKISVRHSTSTMFYDLDSIAKRHSFHCLTEISSSNANVLTSMYVTTKNVIDGKSNAIVQDCAAETRSAFTKRDSRDIIAKRMRKKYPQECVLSSDIFLRDDIEANPDRTSTLYNVNDISDLNSRPQKFWSYAKYRTEYTKPISEEKKKNKKDRGKRIENPCPCQLFSYACPCSDKKSLTELAKNSKSLTVADQNTSTVKIVPEAISARNKKFKKFNEHRDDKLTSMSGDGVVKKQEIEIQKNESVVQVVQVEKVSKTPDTRYESKVGKKKANRYKKSHVFKCPNCNEKIEVCCSTEDEENIKSPSPIYGQTGIIDSKAFAYRTSSSKNPDITEEKNECPHRPVCEMVPVCQILPDRSISKFIRKPFGLKSAPRTIRITKACRHHPPCTVVPSCQRANVLKNNCEFIPPCLHRPRCVNLPLCVPFSKSLHYDESTNNYVNLERDTECFHVPQCKYVPMCQQESLDNSIMSHDFMGKYNYPSYFVNQNPIGIRNTISPCSFGPLTPCNCCKLNKSCQYDCYDCKCINNTNSNENEINSVVYIRDVGCQFRNKTVSPDGSVLQSRICYTSSASFESPNMRTGHFYTSVHTTRCEDKNTSPISIGEDSISSDSITSMEVDIHCPSHGLEASKKSRLSGFNPEASTSPYVTAFMTDTDLTSPMPKYTTQNSNKKSSGKVFPVKSRRSFFKGKCRKMCNVKRRRKSRVNELANSYSQRVIYQKQATS